MPLILSHQDEIDQLALFVAVEVWAGLMLDMVGKLITCSPEKLSHCCEW